jgi:hypothetical protein
MTGTALVPTGKVTHCCGSHVIGPVGACCDPDDCSPCCPECITCPIVRQQPPARRRAAAAACREFEADMISMARAASRAWEQYKREIGEPEDGTDLTPIYTTMIREFAGAR